MSSAREEDVRPSTAGSAVSLPSVPSDALWHCSFQCGKTYKKSSGRSIRRHVIACFRQHWPGGDALKEEELSRLISSQQESGKLTTGLRRWKMRQSRRNADDLSDSERWTCPFQCGKHYRSTSSRSIQLHANRCPLRNDGGHDDVDVKALKAKQDDQRRKDREERAEHREGRLSVMDLPQLDGATDLLYDEGLDFAMQLSSPQHSATPSSSSFSLPPSSSSSSTGPYLGPNAFVSHVGVVAAATTPAAVIAVCGVVLVVDLAPSFPSPRSPPLSTPCSPSSASSRSS